MNTQLEQFQTNVKRLGEITAKMAVAPVCGSLGAPKEFKVEGGIAQVWLLHERESASIVKAYLSPGAVFPVHSHAAVEVMVLLEGFAVYESGNMKKELHPGLCVRVPREKGHRVRAGSEGAWFSVTTVPRERDLVSVGGAENGR